MPGVGGRRAARRRRALLRRTGPIRCRSARPRRATPRGGGRRRRAPGWCFAHRGELPLRPALPVPLPGASFLRQRVDNGQFIENRPVRGTVEAPVEADRAEVREPRRGRPDHRHGVVGVAALPHDRVGRDEPPWPRDADRNPGPDRTSGLAFRDPPRVRLEYREGPLAVRDRPDPERAAVNPCGLPHRMRYAVADGVHRRYIDAACLQFRKGSLRAQHQQAAQIQVRLHIRRLGAAGHPDRREPLPHPLRQVPPPCSVAAPPVPRTMQRTASRSGTASVGWRTSVSPGGSHSARPGARRAFLARPHGRSPRPGCWPPPATPGPGAPHCPRGSGIGGGACPKHPGVRGTAGSCGARSPTPAGGRNRIPGPASRRPYPGCATSRAGPAHTPVGARKNVSLQKREQTRPQSFVFGRILEARKQRRDVVPGFGVDPGIPDVDPAQFHPPIAHIPRFTSGGITENDLFLAETARNWRLGPNLRSGNIPVCGMESSG